MSLGLQLPSGQPVYDPIGSVSYSDGSVNISATENNAKFDSNNAKEKPYMQPWKVTVPSALLPLRLCLLVVTELIQLFLNKA